MHEGEKGVPQEYVSSSERKKSPWLRKFALVMGLSGAGFAGGELHAHFEQGSKIERGARYRNDLQQLSLVKVYEDDKAESRLDINTALAYEDKDERQKERLEAEQKKAKDILCDFEKWIDTPQAAAIIESIVVYIPIDKWGDVLSQVPNGEERLGEAFKKSWGIDITN